MLDQDKARILVHHLQNDGYTIDGVREYLKKRHYRLRELQKRVEAKDIMTYPDPCGNPIQASGICEVIGDFNIIEYMMLLWGDEYEYYSGDPDYPVKGGACDYYDNEIDHWYTGYGLYRQALIMFLIDKINYVLKEM